MKYITILRLHHLLLACLLIFSINVCAEEVTTTYTFTKSKSWEATEGGNWTSGKDGATNNTINSGVMVSSIVSGAFAKSPVSFTNISNIAVTYCTNDKSGTGTIDIWIGDKKIGSKDVEKPTSNGGTPKTFKLDNVAASGKVLIAVTTTEGSIYIKDITITHEGTYNSGVIDEGDFCGNNNTAAFIFNTDLGLAYLHLEKPSGTKGDLWEEYTVHSIVMSTSDKTKTQIYKTYLSVPNGYSLTFSGENIATIEITGTNLNYLSANDKSLALSNFNKAGTWTGNSSSVTLKSSGSVTINSIIVTYNKTDFSVSSVGYATYYNAFPYVMPEGVEGKTMVLENGAVRSKIVFTAGDVVPAETALLLKGTSKSYTITKTDAAEKKSAEGNLLRGLLTEGTTTGGSGDAKYYKLANGENGLGWYYGSADNTDGHAFVTGANKAYLVLEAAAYNSIAHARNFISIDEDATAAFGLKSDESNTRIYYNLMGQRTSADAKGIVIVNGKKVLNK